ncbi:Bile acid 7-alpha dehydratase [compost metagenome]
MEKISNADLIAIEEIKQMKARYCRFVDTKQWESLRVLLAVEAKLSFEGQDGEQLYKFDGRDQWIDLTSGVLAKARTVHQVHSPEIEVLSATRAKGIWGMEDIIEMPEGIEAPFKTMHGFGHYYEELEKTDSGWIIISMVLKRTKLNQIT